MSLTSRDKDEEYKFFRNLYSSVELKIHNAEDGDHYISKI